MTLFVQVSGYTLQELQGQPHNMVRHPDMPKAAFADMWFTLKRGAPERHREKSPQKWRPLLGCGPMRYRWCAREKSVAICRFVPGRRMKRSRRWSRCTKALNAGRTSKRIHKGPVVRKGWLGKLPSLPLRWRARGVMTLMFILLAAMLWFCCCPGGDVYPLCISGIVGKRLF